MDKKLEEINVLIDKNKTELERIKFLLNVYHSYRTYYYLYDDYLMLKEDRKKLKRQRKDINRK